MISDRVKAMTPGCGDGAGGEGALEEEQPLERQSQLWSGEVRSGRLSNLLLVYPLGPNPDLL